MLEIKRLRLIRELALRGSVASVAKALNYTPSAVSQQLTQLESEIGVELTRRSGRGLELTPAGVQLAQDTEQLLNRMEEIEAGIKHLDGEIRGTLRVAVFQTAVLALMPAALTMLRENHPNLRVEMVQYEPETALRETWARSFDLVVAEQYPGHAAAHFPGLNRHPLTTDELVFCVPRVGELSGIKKLSDAADVPWVLEPMGAASRHWAEQVCRAAGFDPDVRFETADLQAHLKLIESGNAVGILPGLLAPASDDRIYVHQLAGKPQRTIFTGTREASTGRAAIDAVLEALDKAAEELRVK